MDNQLAGLLNAAGVDTPTAVPLDSDSDTDASGAMCTSACSDRGGSCSPTPRLALLPLAAIRFSLLTPRAGDPVELAALARSMGAPEGMTLAHYPAVEEAPGGYRLLYGARRVAAALLADWTHIHCLIYPPLDPLVAHGLRLRENLHHLALDPWQEAVALRISYLLANAAAIDCDQAARQILAREEPLAAKIQPLLALLEDAGWREADPAVSWGEVLDDLGLDLEPGARRRRLRMLNIDPQLYAPLREVGLTAPAVRAIGALSAEQQQTLIAAIRQDPALARKVRRISRVVRGKKYTLDEALDEARAASRRATNNADSAVALAAAGARSGTAALADREQTVKTEFYDAAVRAENAAADNQTITDQIAAQPADDQTDSTQVAPHAQAAVTELLEIANRLAAALRTLQSATASTPPGALPAPWGDYSRTALELIALALREHGVKHVL